MSTHSPCYKCTERTRICHDTCKRHHDWLEEEHKKKAFLAGGSISDVYAAEAISRSNVKIAKYKQNRRTYFKKHR